MKIVKIVKNDENNRSEKKYWFLSITVNIFCYFLKFSLNMSDKKELEKIDELLGKLIGEQQITDILKTNNYPN